MVLTRPDVPPRARRRRALRFKRISMNTALVRDDQTLRCLSRCFRKALSKTPKTQQAGVKYLAEASTKRNYAICVLCLAFDDFVPTRVCQYAAKNFTDHIRNRWSPTSSDIKPIPDAEKSEIIDLILAEISNAPSRLESRLSQALTIIGLELDPSEVLPDGSVPSTHLRKFSSVLRTG